MKKRKTAVTTVLRRTFLAIPFLALAHIFGWIGLNLWNGKGDEAKLEIYKKFN